MSLVKRPIQIANRNAVLYVYVYAWSNICNVTVKKVFNTNVDYIFKYVVVMCILCDKRVESTNKCFLVCCKQTLKLRTLQPRIMVAIVSCCRYYYYYCYRFNIFPFSIQPLPVLPLQLTPPDSLSLVVE